jgi:hypothetical protein
VAAPHWADKLDDWSRIAAARPLRYFAALFAAAALADVPLALVFSPEAWDQFGPFALQLSRPALYALYFFAGAGLGACGAARAAGSVDPALAALVRRGGGITLTASISSITRL